VQVWAKRVLIGYAIYLGLSVLVVLPLLNYLPKKVVQNNFQRQLQADLIYFNPFALSLVANEVSLPNRDGSHFVSFDEAEINLSVEGLWRQGWVLDTVSLKTLAVHVERLESGEFTFQDLITSAEEPIEPDQAEAGEIPGVTIHMLRLDSEQIMVTDRSREEPFSTHWDGLDIQVNDLSTVMEDGRPYTLSVRGEGGGELNWEGAVSIPAAFSEGKLSLSNISLLPISRFLKPWVAFDIASGAVSVSGNYRISWQDQLDYRISEASARLATLEILPQNASELEDTRLALDAIDITGIDLDGLQQAIQIDKVTITGPVVEAWSEGSKVSLITLLNTDKLPTTEESAEPNEEDEGSEWTISLAGAEIIDGAARWRSEFTEPALTEVFPLAVTVGAVQWPPAGDTPLALSLKINEQAAVNVSGGLGLANGNGTLDFELADLQLPWFSPSIPDALQATLDSGTAATKGSLTLANFSPEGLTLDGSIRELFLTIAGEEKALTGWESLHWKTLAVDFSKQYVSLDTLRLNEYSGRVHIYADGSINTSRVLAEELEKADVEIDVAAEAAGAWDFDIRSIQITDSQVDFMDESLPIVFRTLIGGLDGEINSLSSDPEKTAEVDMSGSVDGYAPVLLSGTARPMAEPPALNLGLSFEGVDLARLTPYSGTYAGYAIERGVMTLKVKYTLADDSLTGDNNLVIDQLKLGEKIDSDKAVDLPIGLAIALLTDANGVIDLAVPVSGNLDDPGFSIGGVIAGAFINLIGKAATAPFNLLAGLVGSDEDLQRVNFPAGYAELDDAAKKKLTDLGTAMSQRPGLTLLIDGRINRALDTPRLQKNALAAEFIAGGISADEVKSKGPDWAKKISSRYNNLGLPPPENGEGLSIRKQYEAVAASLPVSEDALQTLAEERAVETKRFLVNEVGVPANQAAIDSVDLSEAGHNFSGVEMDIDT
jgi:hypothetical protein